VWLLAPVLGAALLGPSCATLEQLSDLGGLEFFLDRVDRAVLAGVDLDRMRRFEDLRSQDVLRIADGVRRGRLPLEFVLHVGARNPSDTPVAVRLEQLDWTLLLEDRETVSGVLRDDIVLEPARTSDIPLPIELDLLRFFDDNARDLADLALRAAGAGGQPKNLKLRARPTVRTPLGVFRFPEEITIVSRDV
jgi:hypothetical protein